MKLSYPRATVLMAVAVFLISFSAYVLTLAPTITMEDSGELVTAAATLGIAHPSGYPLYVILGKLFTLLPFGTVAWRVNLMSAVFGALTVALLSILLWKLLKRRIIAAALSLFYAFSPIFWSQSIIAEVYTLNSFFVVLLILIALLWREERRSSYLCWFAFILGLSMTNHTMMVMLVPAFVAFFFFEDSTILRRWKLLFALVICGIAGLALYAYIPFRAFQQPLFNWGPIDSWRDAAAHILRSDYNDFAPFDNQFSKVGIVIDFLFDIYQQFYLPTLALALVGAVYLWKRLRTVAILTTLIFLGNSLGIIYLRKFGWGLGIDYTYRVYYLPAFMMVVVWLGYSCSYLIDFLSRLWKERSPMLWKSSIVVLYVVIVSLPISFLVANYEKVDLSRFWFNHDYTKNLLDSLPENALFFFAYDGSLQGDTEIFSLVYLQLVEGVRPDVAVVTDLNFFYKRFRLNLPLEYFDLDFSGRRNRILELLNTIPDRPIYANFAITEHDSDGRWWGVSNGYAYHIVSASTTPMVVENFNNSAIRGLDEINEDSEFPSAGLAAHYYYALAAHYLVAGDKETSQAYLIKAFNLDTAPFNHEYRRFLDYRTELAKHR